METPIIFKQIINTVYPYENLIEFERWFDMNYIDNNYNRKYLDIYWCSYQVNNNYGNDLEAINKLQIYIDSLPRNEKYFTISQYDNGVGVDFKDLDVLQFNMSKNIGIPIPLLCMQHSYKHDGSKNIFASFIGTHTHPIREKVFNITNKEYYISDKEHNTHDFCNVIARSIFGLCPRGYGFNSFRIMENMQYGTIPVYISDEFIIPFDLDFSEYGILIPECDADNIEKILKSYTPLQIIDMQDKCKQVYQEYYTYAGALNKIMKYLES
jgi:hypothetical protein